MAYEMLGSLWKRKWNCKIIFVKAKYCTSLWASTQRVFKGFPFSIIVNDWKDVIGRQLMKSHLLHIFVLEESMVLFSPSFGLKLPLY